MNIFNEEIESVEKDQRDLLRLIKEGDRSDKYYQLMYLDWFNNFLSVDRFAEYYGLTKVFADTVIQQGRKIHDKLTEVTA